MKNTLKKFLQRTAILCLLFFVIIFACMGIVMGHSLTNALEPPNFANYEDRLEGMAYPERMENSEKSSAVS